MKKRRFSNLNPATSVLKSTDLLRYMLSKRQKIWPDKVDIKKIGDIKPRVATNMVFISYVGHVSFLIQTAGLNILTDPVWSSRASPLPFVGPKRVSEPGIDFEKLPPIDVVLVSHNHYDHMDMPTLKKLHQQHKPKIITPLMNDRIIHKSIPDADIDVLDWGDSANFKSCSFHLEPAQHWSSRAFFDQNKALWGTFIIRSENTDICFIGDTGYDKKIFKDIGKKYNIFLSLIPIGAYKPRWFMHNSHVDPAQAVQIFEDLRSTYALASHFDCFALGAESYGDAPRELLEALQSKSLDDKFLLPDYGITYRWMRKL